MNYEPIPSGMETVWIYHAVFGTAALVGIIIFVIRDFLGRKG